MKFGILLLMANFNQSKFHLNLIFIEELTVNKYHKQIYVIYILLHFQQYGYLFSCEVRLVKSNQPFEKMFSHLPKLSLLLFGWFEINTENYRSTF